MAYIDREQACENCNNKNYCQKEKCPVYKVSAADVVPKSEVEKLQNELVIWKQNRFNLYQKLECYEMARQKVAREIFEEIDDAIDNLRGAFLRQRISEIKREHGVSIK